MLHGTSLTRSGTSRILASNEGLTLEQATANVEKVANKGAGNVTDRWILHNLNVETIGKVTENFDKFGLV